jgi:hypothetical protein
MAALMPELPIDSTALEVLAMMAFSLWKTYIGPLMAAFLGYSYWQMLLCNLGPALLSASAVVWADDVLRRRRVVTARGFNRHLRRALRFWRSQGEPVAALLSPVLLGIPVYAFVARRLRTSRRRVLWTVAVVTTFWCSLIYFGAEQAMDLSALLRERFA